MEISENKKLSQLRECFNKQSCKCTVCHCHENVDDKELKGRILEAELHKELLSDVQPCSQEHCHDCNNTLC